jgi:hypothetical protein
MDGVLRGFEEIVSWMVAKYRESWRKVVREAEAHIGL